ncbi:membrane protein of unknown function [Nitrospira japonica]|uniref:Glycosyltransferase RgtA/B/C/D-like domain-containing protein n=1 Tax=Nitrospira japonica TaxID=1325564 RepID=A0A1W1IB85_9BACT|nr:glycosyltransferase family 39 protein [Nitrospira japonica]SLM50266.1 membrane protein of unknown function [Nitrospira japonica]
MTWLATVLPTGGDRLRRALVVVVLFSILSKLMLGALVFSLNPDGIFESSDAHEYHQLALNMARYGTFSRSVNPPLDPEIIRTPAYPLLLAGLYQVVGIRPHAVIPVQIALSVVTLLAGFRIACLLFGPRAGLLTAVFLALDPVSMYYSQVMLTETLFGTALTLCLLGMVQAIRIPSPRYPSWAGVCLAAATYIRPTGYYLGLLLPMVLFLAIQRSGGWRRALASAALMGIIFFVLVGGWQVRNYVATGSTAFSQAKNQYLLIAKAAAIVAMRDGVSLQEAQQRLADEHAASLPPKFFPASQALLLESQGQFAQSVIAAHPVLLVVTTSRGMAANLLGPSNMAHLLGSDNVALRDAFLQRDFARFPPSYWMAALSSWTVGVLFLGIVYGGVVLLFKRKGFRNGDIALLVLTAVYVILVSSGPEAYSRFRMPIMPILCVLAAGGYLCRGVIELGECDDIPRGALERAVDAGHAARRLS